MKNNFKVQCDGKRYANFQNLIHAINFAEMQSEKSGIWEVSQISTSLSVCTVICGESVFTEQGRNLLAMGTA